MTVAVWRAPVLLANDETTKTKIVTKGKFSQSLVFSAARFCVYCLSSLFCHYLQQQDQYFGQQKARPFDCCAFLVFFSRIFSAFSFRLRTKEQGGRGRAAKLQRDSRH